MLVLAIDTTTTQSSVCVGGPDGPLASAALGRPQAHGAFLTPAIDFCLRQAGVTAADLTGVAVALGPGLYTGMRVGIAAAQGLAHARQLPVVGLNSLDLLAFPFRLVRRDRRVAAVIDARRGELFWALYRPAGDGMVRTSDLSVGTPDKLVAEVEASPEGTICVGDGAVAHEGVLRAAGAQIASPWIGRPHATALAELAVPRLARGDTQRPEDLRPIYLRAADARINWSRRGALAGGVGDAEERSR